MFTYLGGPCRSTVERTGKQVDMLVEHCVVRTGKQVGTVVRTGKQVGMLAQHYRKDRKTGGHAGSALS